MEILSWLVSSDDTVKIQPKLGRHDVHVVITCETRAEAEQVKAALDKHLLK